MTAQIQQDFEMLKRSIKSMKIPNYLVAIDIQSLDRLYSYLAKSYRNHDDYPRAFRYLNRIIKMLEAEKKA